MVVSIPNETSWDDVDISNVHMVSAGSRGIVIIAPPIVPMTKTDALVFAAWIVALADEDGSFPDLLARVQDT